MDAVRTSRRLSRVLRHAPQSVGLTLDGGGWVDIPVLLAALADHGAPLARDALERVVAENDKQRFEIVGDRIRARQGHTVPVDLGLAPTVPPDRLYHGTTSGTEASIRRQGLLRGRRHHVHLSADRRAAARVGARRGRPVVLEVDAARMASDGHAFLVTGNGVWLTDRVPPQYLRWESPGS